MASAFECLLPPHRGLSLLQSMVRPSFVYALTASEQTGNTWNGFEDDDLKAQAESSLDFLGCVRLSRQRFSTFADSTTVRNIPTPEAELEMPNFRIEMRNLVDPLKPLLPSKKGMS